ncbi:helix-turn-helix domain-containing protein [Chloroflexota bacterium]
MNGDKKNNDFGRFIRQQRVMIPLTLHELSSQSGVSPSHLGRMERGERSPSAGVLQKIASPLKYNVNELFVLAGYLPPQSNGPDGTGEGHKEGKLDPYVSWALSQEPLEVQRAVIGILTVIKGAYRSSSLN